MVKYLLGLNWFALVWASLYIVAIYSLPCVPSQSTASQERHAQQDYSAHAKSSSDKRSLVGTSHREKAADKAPNGKDGSREKSCLAVTIWKALELTFRWWIGSPESFWASWVAAFTAMLVYRAWTQERANIAMERAYVLATVHMEVFQMPRTPRAPLPAEITRAWVIYKNHGKTPAFVTLIRGYIEVRKDYPKELLDIGPLRSIPEGIVLGAGEEYRIDFIEDLDDMVPYDWVVERVLCLGMIRYRDIFNKTRETGYCWQYQERFGTGSFHIAPADDLNYHT